MYTWRQVGPGKYAQQGSSSSGLSVPSSSHHLQITISRSEITSLIDTAVAEALSKQRSSTQNTEFVQQPLSSDLNATVKVLSDEFQDFKKSIQKRLDVDEKRLENLLQRCDRIEKATSDELNNLKTSFKKLQEEFQNSCQKITRHVEAVEGKLNPSHAHQLVGDPESKLKYHEVQDNEFEPSNFKSGSKLKITDKKTTNADKPTSSAIELKIDGKRKTFSEIPIAEGLKHSEPPMSLDSRLEEQPMSLDSRLEEAMRENIKFVNKHIPIPEIQRDDEPLMSLESRLEPDMRDKQLIKSSFPELSRDPEPLMSLESRLEPDMREKQLIKSSFPELSRDSEPLMSLESRLEQDMREKQLIKSSNPELSIDAKQPMSLESRVEHDMLKK